ncbi:hypothetical protein [Streptomyces sp. or3]|uniref:hypothetical protein n=1 Tax=Streptomyces sp. or3 TaxID=1828020 RepID=UPI0015CF086F|nr:hypothetical protein [Streptomyces sp. or3]
MHDSAVQLGEGVLAFEELWTHMNPYGQVEVGMNAHLDLAAAAAAPLPGPRSGEPATV